MPFSYKTAHRHLRVLKCIARRIIRGLEYPSTLSYSDYGSVYIHTSFKHASPKSTDKITTRLSYHILQASKLPEIDIVYNPEMPDIEFVGSCISQIHQLVEELISCGAQKSKLPEK